MSLGLVGRKIGMTRILPTTVFVPVTVLDVSNNRVSRVKRPADGMLPSRSPMACQAQPFDQGGYRSPSKGVVWTPPPV